MALGVPVVATSAAARGLEARRGEHFLVEDDPARFAQARDRPAARSRGACRARRPRPRLRRGTSFLARRPRPHRGRAGADAAERRRAVAPARPCRRRSRDTEAEVTAAMSLRIRRVETEAEFRALARRLDRPRRAERPDLAVPQPRLVRLLLARGGPRPPTRGARRRGRRASWWPLVPADAVEGAPARYARTRRLALLECPDTPFIDVLVGAAAPARSRPLSSSTLPRAATGTSPACRSSRGRLATAQGAGGSPARPAAVAPRGGVALAVPGHRGDWETFWKGTSQRFKKTCRNIQNRLERAGRVRIEEHTQVDPEGPLFAELVELSRRSWKGDRGVAIATMPNMHGFFAALTRRAAARRLAGRSGRSVSTAGSSPWSTSFATTAASTRCAPTSIPPSARSPRAARSTSRSPARYSSAAGSHEYDMGPGLNDYKLRWATGNHEAAHLMVYRPTAYGRLLHSPRHAGAARRPPRPGAAGMSLLGGLVHRDRDAARRRPRCSQAMAARVPGAGDAAHPHLGHGGLLHRRGWQGRPSATEAAIAAADLDLVNLAELRALTGLTAGCEVLARLYELEGWQGLRHLRGAFAVALWDPRQDAALARRGPFRDASSSTTRRRPTAGLRLAAQRAPGGARRVGPRWTPRWSTTTSISALVPAPGLRS